MSGIGRLLPFAFVLVGVACASKDVAPSGPTFSINGPGNCVKTRAITPGEVAGSGFPDKTLALTFDDGPSEATEGLSTYLKQQGIKATFFVNGMHVEGREDTLDKLVADGHLVGNHTQQHLALSTLSAADILDEVKKTDDLIASKVPNGKLFLRPPFGDWNQGVVDALTTMQKYKGPVGWDIGDSITETSAADWDCWSPDNGTKTVQECGDLYTVETRAKGRGVILLHDGPPGGDGAKTVQMIKYIVPLLKAEGFKFIRVDEAELKPFGAEPGPGGGTGSSGTSGSSSGAPTAPDPCK